MRFRSKRTSPGDMPTPVLGLLGVLLGLTLLGLGFDIRASPSRSFGLVVVPRQGSGRVAFEVYENVGTLWSKPGATQAIWTLLVTTRGDQLGATALWQVETETPHRGPITYGHTPEGFVQMIPGTGAAPALQADEAYDVAVLGPGGAGRARFSL